MNESQLIALAAQGEDTSIARLAEQYSPVVWKMRHQYYIRNFDEDDWMQEARIAIHRAAQQYQQARACSFGAYYRLLLNNQIIDQIRRTQARKRCPEGEVLSLNVTDEETLSELRMVPISTLDVIAVREQVIAFGDICSNFEGQVFVELLAGYSPEGIARTLQVEIGPVANAVDRCRKKLRQLLMVPV